MIQGRVDRKEGTTGRGRRAGKGWEWGGVLEAGGWTGRKGRGGEYGNGRGSTGSWRWGRGKGEVKKNGKIRGDFTDEI